MTPATYSTKVTSTAYEITTYSTKITTVYDTATCSTKVISTAYDTPRRTRPKSHFHSNWMLGWLKRSLHKTMYLKTSSFSLKHLQKQASFTNSLKPLHLPAGHQNKRATQVRHHSMRHYVLLCVVAFLSGYAHVQDLGNAHERPQCVVGRSSLEVKTSQALGVLLCLSSTSPFRVCGGPRCFPLFRSRVISFARLACALARLQPRKTRLAGDTDVDVGVVVTVGTLVARHSVGHWPVIRLRTRSCLRPKRLPPASRTSLEFRAKQ